MKSKEKKHTIELIIILFLIGIVFFFIVGRNKGVVLQKDSQAYINALIGTVGIMPFYPSFLKCLQMIFGNENYLLMASVIQGVFAVFTSIYFSLWIKKRTVIKELQTIFIFILTLLPYGFSLPEEVVSHQIMTEALAFPVFYFYFMSLMDFLLKKEKKYILISFAELILLIGLRKQLIFLLIIHILVLLYFEVFIKKIPQKTIIGLALLVLCVFSFCLCFAFNSTSKAIHKLDGTQVVDALLGKLIYVSEQSDSTLFADETMQEAFIYLYDYANQEKKLYYYSNMCEEMQWEHVLEGINYSTRSSWSNLKNYCKEKKISNQYIEYIQTELMFTLLKAHIVDLLYVSVIMIGQSLISAIFIKKNNYYLICGIVSTLIYAFSFFLRVFYRKKINRIYFYYYDLTLLILFFNILILNFFFMGLQRYVVYTFGLFYISIYIIFIKGRENKKRIK